MSSLMRKYLLPSPKRIITERMELLGQFASLLDEIVDDYRGKERKPLDDEHRAIHKEASIAWKEYYDIDAEVNAEYHRYWSS